MQVGGRTEGPERDLSGPPQTYPASLVASACPRFVLSRLPGQDSPGWSGLPRKVLDLLGGPLQDLCHLLEDLGLADRLGGEPVGGAPDVAEGEVDLVHRLVEEVADQLADAVEDRVDRLLVLDEVGATGVGDLVDLLSFIAGNDAGVAEVLEELEGRVDGAGAGGVGAAEALLERLDDLVAVAGLLLEEAEDDVAQVALLEHASGAPSPAAASLGAEQAAHEVGVPSPFGACA